VLEQPQLPLDPIFCRCISLQSATCHLPIKLTQYAVAAHAETCFPVLLRHRSPPFTLSVTPFTAPWTSKTTTPTVVMRSRGHRQAFDHFLPDLGVLDALCKKHRVLEEFTPLPAGDRRAGGQNECPSTPGLLIGLIGLT
jgi:hypothetical protein